MTAPGLVDFLRVETRAAHDRIEAAVDLARHFGSLAAYRDLLARLYGFHAVFEAEAGALLAATAFAAHPARTPALRRDLSALGLDAAAVTALPLAPPSGLANPAAALGALYVVEGSRLGGLVLAAEARRRLALGPDTGAAFLAGEGRDTATGWRRFCARLDAAADRRCDPDAVAGANLTFAAMQAWLAPGPAAADIHAAA